MSIILTVWRCDHEGCTAQTHDPINDDWLLFPRGGSGTWDYCTLTHIPAKLRNQARPPAHRLRSVGGR